MIFATNATRWAFTFPFRWHFFFNFGQSYDSPVDGCDSTNSEILRFWLSSRNRHRYGWRTQMSASTQKLRFRGGRFESYGFFARVTNTFLFSSRWFVHSPFVVYLRLGDRAASHSQIHVHFFLWVGLGRLKVFQAINKNEVTTAATTTT